MQICTFSCVAVQMQQHTMYVLPHVQLYLYQSLLVSFSTTINSNLVKISRKSPGDFRHENLQHIHAIFAGRFLVCVGPKRNDFSVHINVERSQAVVVAKRVST